MKLKTFNLFLLLKGSDRDAVIKRNVIYSLGSQVVTNLLGLLVVPLSLSYINTEKYGIWITASSIVVWFQNMNFGIGFGMQNKVAEAMATNNIDEARGYVSIAYQASLVIAILMLICGIIAGLFIDWNNLFNTTLPAFELKWISAIAFFSFLVYFVLGNLIPLMNAFKRTAVAKFFGLFINILIMFLLFIVSQFSHNDIILASLALAVPTPLVYLIGNWYFFKKHYSNLRPVLRFPDITKVNKIMSIGLKFFVMQLATLVIFQSGSFIITQLIGPAEVTPFNLISRYFYFLFFIFSICIAPFWSAFTEANIKKEYQWINRNLRILFVIACIASLITLVMLYFSFYLIPVWSRHSFNIDNYRLLSYSVTIFIILNFFTAIISTYLCGVTRLKSQLIVGISMAMLVIPMSVFFVKYLNLGSAGVSISMVISQIVFLIVCGWDMRVALRNNSTAVK